MLKLNEHHIFRLFAGPFSVQVIFSMRIIYSFTPVTIYIAISVLFGCGGGIGGSSRPRDKPISPSVFNAEDVNARRERANKSLKIRESFKNKFHQIYNNYKTSVSQYGVSEKTETDEYYGFWSMQKFTSPSQCFVITYNVIFRSAHRGDVWGVLSSAEYPDSIADYELPLRGPHWTNKAKMIDLFSDFLGIGKPKHYAFVEANCCNDDKCDDFELSTHDDEPDIESKQYLQLSDSEIIWNLRSLLSSGFIKTKPIDRGISFELPEAIINRLRKILSNNLSRLSNNTKSIQSKLYVFADESLKQNTRQYLKIFYGERLDTSCPSIQFIVYPAKTSEKYEWLGEKSHFILPEYPEWDSQWTLTGGSSSRMTWTYSECEGSRATLVWPGSR